MKRNEKISLKSESKPTSKLAKFRVLILPFLTAFILITSLLFAYSNVRNSNKTTMLKVIVDPVIVMDSGENHLSNAEVFTYTTGSEKRKYTTHIAAMLSSNQSAEYRFNLINEGTTDVKYELSFKLEEQKNVKVRFVSQDENETSVHGKILPDKKIVKIVEVEIIDETLDASVLGDIYLTLYTGRAPKWQTPSI